MKVSISNSTYIFLLISFLSGYFEYLYILLLIIFIHECGHLFFYRLVSNKECNITIYPFGGLTTFNEEVNLSTFKELFILFGGIIFQLLFYALILKLHSLNLITNHVYNIIKNINYILISFNFMGVVPLDGGKLLNLILDLFLPYKLSFKISIIISIIFSIIFLLNKFNLFRVLLFIFLIKSIYNEIKSFNTKYNRFILERYLNNYNFKHIKKIKNIDYLYKNNYHIINNEFESVYLSKKFDRTL